MVGEKKWDANSGATASAGKIHEVSFERVSEKLCFEGIELRGTCGGYEVAEKLLKLSLSGLIR